MAQASNRAVSGESAGMRVELVDAMPKSIHESMIQVAGDTVPFEFAEAVYNLASFTDQGNVSSEPTLNASWHLMIEWRWVGSSLAVVVSRVNRVC